jgi:flavodoxin
MYYKTLNKMKTLIISYSLTGNNDALATSIATALAAEHTKVIELKPRTMFTIFIDMLFNRTPLIMPLLEKPADYDLVIFMAPVWMGQVATPLRACFKQLKASPAKYAFVSVSGGSAGPNTKLETDLVKRTGKAPAALIDLHIADLLPANPKPTQKDTAAYRLNSNDVKKLAEIAVKKLQEKKLVQSILAEEIPA